MRSSSAAPSAAPGLTGILRRLVLDEALDEKEALALQEAAHKQRSPMQVFLAEQKAVDPTTLAAAVAAEFGLSVFDTSCLDPHQVAPLVNLVGEEWVSQNNVLPLVKRGQKLFVGVSDPAQTAKIDELRFKTGLNIETVIVEHAKLVAAIDAVSRTQNLTFEDGDMDLEVDLSSDESSNETGVNVEEGEESPVVKFVNKMLMDAIKRGASDIHFEPYETEYRVRFRMDGLLKTVANPPLKLNARLAARLKVMAQLDIAERRVPQDGRIKLNISKTKQMDFRVSTLPTLFGEKIVLRLLDGGAAKLGIDKLGYEEDQKELYLKALANPYGMILVTGPTGSGKTVSLYTGLNILNTQERNIATAEDPVEIRVPGINQVQIDPKKGMTFAAALKSFLRQDPDVIMVGEIRDLETAEIAVKAAQTGHLVISTLHTNDAPATVARLMKMGVKPFDITTSVSLVIAQRLARRLCTSCRQPANHSEARLLSAGFTPEQIASGLNIMAAKPGGCSECNDGYKGRVGIYQVMPMTEKIQDIILREGSVMEIEEACQASGISNLRQSALKKVMAGIIDLEEADRVTLT